MLSIVDIKREIGTNIYLYPIHSESIKGNSVDLHASRFAWSLKTSKRLAVQDNHLILPPHDTSLIYTEESIYVSEKIGGTYHSKVTLVSKGLGHIGTTQDPKYLGNSLIAIHNHRDNPFSLRIGSEFVSLIFYYLASADYKNTCSHDSHLRMLDGLEGKDEYIEWRDQNKWTVQQNILYNKMIDSDEYRKCKQDFEREQAVFNRMRLRNRTKRYLLTLAVFLVLFALFAIPSYWIELGSVSQISLTILEKILFPLLVAVVSSQVLFDIKSSKNN